MLSLRNGAAFSLTALWRASYQMARFACTTASAHDIFPDDLKTFVFLPRIPLPPKTLRGYGLPFSKESCHRLRSAYQHRHFHCGLRSFAPGTHGADISRKTENNRDSSVQEGVWKQHTFAHPILRYNSDEMTYCILRELYDLTGLHLDNLRKLPNVTEVYVHNSDYFNRVVDRIVEWPDRTLLLAGSPGIGKSSAALISAIKMIPEHDITWMHFPIGGPVYIVKFQKGVLGKVLYLRVRKRDFVEFLEHQIQIQPQVIVMDGLTDKVDGLNSIMDSLVPFTESHENNRCLVASSLAASKVFERAEFFPLTLLAPTLDEYNTAVSKETFLASVWDMLLDDFKYRPSEKAKVTKEGALLYYQRRFDMDQRFPEIDLDEKFELKMNVANGKRLVKEKWHFAGHSWRYTFYRSVNQIKYDIASAVNSVKSVDELCDYLNTGVGKTNDDIRNRLVFDCSSGFRSIVSSYAVEVLSMERGPAVLDRLQKYIGHLSGRGYIFECKFFASIKFGQLRLKDAIGNVILKDELPGKVFKADCEEFGGIYDLEDVGENKNLWGESGESYWIKPKSKQQGGFDAVHLNEQKGVIRFFQVTVQSHTHIFKPDYFLNFGDTLRILGIPIKHAEIIFVLDSDPSVFRLPYMPAPLSADFPEYPFPLNENNFPDVKIYALQMDKLKFPELTVKL
ncbi:uncharacterized protein LOC129584949 isoform X2 [Paramacrobiotus metropolitanus]|nr:uncharacterized protein LOC129584949 isoform X2 [Paramacrobiotus metropolitanus]